MKYLILGDIHGHSLEKLTKEVEVEAADILLCTGDFDRVPQIVELRKIIKDYDWKRVHMVPGNHDDAIYNNQEISSPDIRRLRATVNQLHVELKRNNQASKFIETILKSGTKKFDLKEYESLLIHGALNGDLSNYPSCPDEKRKYWFRLRNKEDHRKNFEQMRDEGIDLMIRGHDHEPEYAYLEEDEVKRKFPEENEVYEINNSPVTVTHGAWKDGWYATLEDRKDILRLEFHKLEK